MAKRDVRLPPNSKSDAVKSIKEKLAPAAPEPEAPPEPELPELTDMQKVFVEALLAGNSGLEAARQAGYADPKAAYAVIRSAAVIAHLEYARGIEAETPEVTKHEVISKLREVYKLSKESKQYATAARTAELLGKTAGVFIERSEQIKETTILSGNTERDYRRMQDIRKLERLSNDSDDS